MQVPASPQVRELQHCEEVEQTPPAFTQPDAPTQTPEEQIMEPPQSALLEQGVPDPCPAPSEQTLFALHRRVPQQSPLVEQT